MGYTAKQERNGATGSAGEQDSARTGPIPDVAPLKSQAESAGSEHMTDGHVLVGTLEGHTVPYDWDDGLAVAEQPGEA